MDSSNAQKPDDSNNVIGSMEMKTVPQLGIQGVAFRPQIPLLPGAALNSLLAPAAFIPPFVSPLPQLQLHLPDASLLPLLGAPLHPIQSAAAAGIANSNAANLMVEVMRNAAAMQGGQIDVAAAFAATQEPVVTPLHNPVATPLHKPIASKPVPVVLPTLATTSPTKTAGVLPGLTGHTPSLEIPASNHHNSTLDISHSLKSSHQRVDAFDPTVSNQYPSNQDLDLFPGSASAADGNVQGVSIKTLTAIRRSLKCGRVPKKPKSRIASESKQHALTADANYASAPNTAVESATHKGKRSSGVALKGSRQKRANTSKGYAAVLQAEGSLSGYPATSPEGPKGHQKKQQVHPGQVWDQSVETGQVVKEMKIQRIKAEVNEEVKEEAEESGTKAKKARGGSGKYPNSGWGRPAIQQKEQHRPGGKPKT